MDVCDDLTGKTSTDLTCQCGALECSANEYCVNEAPVNECLSEPGKS